MRPLKSGFFEIHQSALVSTRIFKPLAAGQKNPGKWSVPRQIIPACWAWENEEVLAPPLRPAMLVQNEKFGHLAFSQ
jgi:hypothetical protein